MNGQTVERVLCSHPNAKEQYAGVYLIDKLSHLDTIPKYITINTSTSNIGMGHWTRIYFKTIDEAYFFDSYGRHYSNVNNGHLLDKYLEGIIVHSSKYVVCSYYCLYVAYCLCKGLTFNKMFKMFYKCVEYNDVLIVKLVNDIYNKRLNFH